MASRPKPIPVPRGSTGSRSRLAPLPAIPGTCYRLLRGGQVVVSGGHPSACTCRWNDTLAPPDASYTPSLPAYPVLGAPAHLWDERQRYFDLVLGYSPDIFYPFEAFGIMTHNPFRLPEVVDWTVSCPLGFEPLIALGSALDLLRRGRRSSPVMTMTVANVCRIISQTLYHTDDALGGCLLAHAISSIAKTAFSVGDVAAWRTHMEGLKRYLATTKGEFMRRGAIQMNVVTKVRIADIEGAIIIGTSPYLSFQRVHPLLPCLLPAKQQKLVLVTYRPLLQACGIDAGISDTIIAVCIFVQMFRLSREEGIGERFNPENIMEDWYGLQHDLLTSPSPLLSDKDATASSDATAAAAYLSPSSNCGSSPPAARHVRPAESLDAFVTAFRVVALMSLRAPTLQWPWGRAAYATLLARLEGQLRVLLCWLQQRHRSRQQRDGGRRRRLFVDPSVLEQDDDADVADDDDDAALPGVADARPFLAWMAVMGHRLAVYYGAFHAGWSEHRPDGSVYLQVLRELGVREPADVDAIAEPELDMVRTLDLSWATGVEWDVRELLRSLVR